VEENGKLRFNREITLGNALTILTMVAAFFVAWFRMDSRVNVLERTADENRGMIVSQAEVLRQLSITSAELKVLIQVYSTRQERESRVQAEHNRQ